MTATAAGRFLSQLKGGFLQQKELILLVQISWQLKDKSLSIKHLVKKGRSKRRILLIKQTSHQQNSS